MRTLIANATVIDGLGGIRERQDVVVTDQRITAVGPSGSQPRGDCDRILDLQGRVLMPGLIDTHLHFGGGDYDPDHEDDSVGLAALRSAEAAQRSLMAGFTTIRSAGSPADLDVATRDGVDQGTVIGPRIMASGRGLTMTGGHEHRFALEADGVDAVRKAVRTLVKYRVDSIKIFAISPGVSTAGVDVDTEAFTVEEIRTAVIEATKARKLNLTHSISLAGTKNAIAAGVRSIDHGIFLDEEACRQMVDKGITLVPTFGPFYYYTVRRIAEPWRSQRAEPLVQPHRASFKMALEMGVNIAMGSDLGAASRMKNGENAVELQLMVDAGMKPADAIVAATSSAARLLKLDELLGSVEVGKLADLIVIDGNPIDDITTLQRGVRLVMREGVVHRNDLDA